MQGKKRSSIFLFAGCLLLFAAIFLSRIIYEKAVELNGRVSMCKVTVNIKDYTKATRNSYFGLEDIEKLQKDLYTDVVCYSAQAYSEAVYGENAVKARVTGINELAPMFRDIKITRGSFFSAADNREKSRVAVIEDRLAWKLFNNDDVLGCDVEVFGGRFKIVGIVESDGSVIAKLVDDGSMQVYIPARTYIDYNMDSGISTIEIETDSESTIGKVTDDTADSLVSMGKDRSSYNLVDYNIKNAVMRQKPDLLVFLMGIFIIAVMFVYSFNKSRMTISDIRNECKTDYFTKAIGLHRVEIVISLVSLLSAAACSVIVWKLIRFEVYISPDLIPEDFTDLSYFARLLQQKISLGITDAGYLGPFQEMKTDAAEAALNWVFYTGSLPGILLFYTSLLMISREAIPLEKTILLSGAFLVIDAGIVLLSSYVAGLPVMMELKAIIVFWTFIFTSLLSISFKNHGHIRCNNDLMQMKE